jgi:hypothetical protein
LCVLGQAQVSAWASTAATQVKAKRGVSLREQLLEHASGKPLLEKSLRDTGKGLRGTSPGNSLREPLLEHASGKTLLETASGNHPRKQPQGTIPGTPLRETTPGKSLRETTPGKASGTQPWNTPQGNHPWKKPQGKHSWNRSLVGALVARRYSLHGGSGYGALKRSALGCHWLVLRCVCEKLL